MSILFLAKKKSNCVFTTGIILFRINEVDIKFFCTLKTYLPVEGSAVYVTLSMMSIAQPLLQLINYSAVLFLALVSSWWYLYST